MGTIGGAGPVAVTKSLSQPGVIGSSADASGSSILSLTATAGAFVMASPGAGVVNVFQLAQVTRSQPCLKWWRSTIPISDKQLQHIDVGELNNGSAGPKFTGRCGGDPVGSCWLTASLLTLARDERRSRMLSLTDAAGAQSITCRNTPARTAHASKATTARAYTMWEVWHTP